MKQALLTLLAKLACLTYAAVALYELASRVQS